MSTTGGRRGAGQHRLCQVTPFGVRASSVVRGPLPAVGPLPVTGPVQLSGVGGVLDGPAIVLRGPGAQSGGLGLPAVVLEPDPLRLVVALVAPPLGGFRLGGPLRRVPVVGFARGHRRIAERRHVDGDRRPAPGGMVGRWEGPADRDTRWRRLAADRRANDRVASHRNRAVGEGTVRRPTAGPVTGRATPPGRRAAGRQPTGATGAAGAWEVRRRRV